MDRLLDEYRSQFGEAFPLMLCMGMDDDEIAQIVQQCLNDKKPYEPDIDPEADY